MATDAAYRRRGIAAAVGSRLTELAFGNGAELVFLDVEHPAEERIYVRLGYERGAERVWMSRR